MAKRKTASCTQTKETALNPPATVLIKLGSLIVHYQELTGPLGHVVDRVAINALENDPEVIEWLECMKALAFLSVKR